MRYQTTLCLLLFDICTLLVSLLFSVFRAERAEREKAAKEKAEKERQEKEKERQQMQDRQERARILKESAQLAQDAVDQHFHESLRRVSAVWQGWWCSRAGRDHS